MNNLQPLGQASPFSKPVAFVGEDITPTITGIVEKGRQLGRELGFPTANIRLPTDVAIDFGVYAVRCALGLRRLEGVASIGCNPTVPKDAPVLEVWIFDFDEDIYGQQLTTQLAIYLREELCFPDLDALTRQVLEDAAEARRVLAAG